MLARRKLDKLLNVLGAAAATAGIFQAKFGSELTGQDDPGSSCVTDIRFGDPFA